MIYRKVFLLLCLCLSFSVHGQDLILKSGFQLHSKGNSSISDVLSVGESAYAFGFSEDSKFGANRGGKDALILELGNDFSLKRSFTFGGKKNEQITTAFHSGNAFHAFGYVVGDYKDGVPIPADIFYSKIQPDFSDESRHVFGLGVVELESKVKAVESVDGGFIIAYRLYGHTGVKVIKFDPKLKKVVWEEDLLDNYRCEICDLTAFSEGYCLAGVKYEREGDGRSGDGFMICFNGSGRVIWDAGVATGGRDLVKRVCVLNESEAVFFGETSGVFKGQVGGGKDVFYGSISDKGVIKGAVVQIPDPGLETPVDALKVADKIILVGNVHHGIRKPITNSFGQRGCWVFALDYASGKGVYKYFGTNKMDVVNGMVSGPNGRVSVFGVTTGVFDFCDGERVLPRLRDSYVAGLEFE